MFYTVLFIPLLGTIIGSAMVFFLKDKLSSLTEKAMLGFASGVMIAAAVWSLIIPSIEMAKSHNVLAWVPAAVGFLLGILFLLLMDTYVPHLHIGSDEPEGIRTKLPKSIMMLFAVVLHNIPEGMAVGITYAAADSSEVTMASAVALAAGIAIQNIPEGAIVSMPLRREGFSKFKAFVYGSLSGAVEPVSGLIIAAFSSVLTPVLPYLLSFAAGAMFYVVVEELIPESQAGEHSNIGTIGAALGFVLMMILDVGIG